MQRQGGASWRVIKPAGAGTRVHLLYPGCRYLQLRTTDVGLYNSCCPLQQYKVLVLARSASWNSYHPTNLYYIQSGTPTKKCVRVI
eukprot:797444-Rhodomonas_salina.4